ncbi:glycosyltransferase [Halomonas sp. 86]|uniref:glycosyltransferase n=1 Tax=unclassified Halomonas TaxID=2609666 RepID=UPI0040337F8C
MIFITVGTQLPFDRLLNYFSEWQIKVGYKGEVVAQIGEDSLFISSNMKLYKKLSMDEYYLWFCRADCIVSHAGIGSVLSCLDHNKKGVFLARKCSLSEHRNDHQLDTVSAFSNQYPALKFCMEKLAFQDGLNELVNEESPQVIQPNSNASDLGKKISFYLGF